MEEVEIINDIELEDELVEKLDSDSEQSLMEVTFEDKSGEIHEVLDSSDEEVVNDNTGLSAIANQRLKIHTATKIIRKSKNRKRIKDFTIKRTEHLQNVSSKEIITVTSAIPQGSKFVNTSPKIQLQKVDSNLSIKSPPTQDFSNSDLMNRFNMETSNKINKVVASADLTVQQFKKLESGIQKSKELSNLIKRKLNSSKSIIDHSAPVFSDDDDDRNKYKAEQTSTFSKSDSFTTQSDNFPKAIVYPVAQKKAINEFAKPPPEPVKMSFNEVFTKATAEKVKTEESIREKVNLNIQKKAESGKKIRKSQQAKSEERTDEVEDKETKPIKYLIPQDLIAPKTNQIDRNLPSSSSSSHDSLQRVPDLSPDKTHATLPERPKINHELIDALADYRVIAKYLFNRLNIPPMDFDGTDDYINLYKLSRN